MTWLVFIAAAWIALAWPLGLLFGYGIRVADGRDEASRPVSIVPDFIPDDVVASVALHSRRDK